MMIKKTLIIFCCFFVHFAFSAKVVDVALKSDVYYFFDKSNNLGLDEVLELDSSIFKRTSSSTLNFGLTKYNLWVKFKCSDLSDYESPVLRISYPLLDNLDCFVKRNENYTLFSFSEENVEERMFNNPEYLIPLFNSDSSSYIFLKINSTEQIILPLSIIEKEDLVSDLSKKSVFNGFYIGIVAIMVLYNFFVFLSVRDKAYLSYVLYLLFMGLTQMSIKGSTFYLWGDLIWLKSHESTILSSLGGFFTIVFAVEFLGLKKKYVKIYYFLSFLMIVYIVGIVFSLIDEFFISFSIMQMNTTVTTLALFIISFILAISKQRTAIFFFISWFFLLSGAVVFLLKDYSILPFNFFTDSSMQIASVIEMSLLSFALADRINILKKEKVDAQKRELEVLQENQSLIENRNTELEKMVGERTLDLQSSNNELHNTLDKLQKAQVRLVESEKMVSLGQLTAGVAHEINNPINFVLSNVNPLRRDLDDLLEIIAAYDDVKNQPELGFSKVEALKKSLDYDYLKEEIAQILSGIENGAERTSEIVKSLRMFSRLDESDYKKATIEDCIESTLTVLHAKIKDSLPTIRKEFNFTDEIDCYPGKLNQVFMNIISNALDAIEGKTNGELYFEVVDENDRVKITIKDNGSGMTEKVKEHIFDPFFTTKDVGKGTGLGMSIVYSIIQDHHGEILVDSAVGLGTTFTIYLPIVGHTN